jgi:transcriptional regulator with XRE-family HTH domain
MDQVKTGHFLAQLRKENDLTQEQLADRLGITRRTVSRWETGSNLPDIDLLIELSDMYKVDLREILDGSRKEKTTEQESRETIIKVAEYEQIKNERYAKIALVKAVIGLVLGTTHIFIDYIEMENEFLLGLLRGGTIGACLGTLLFLVLYLTGQHSKICAVKKKLIRAIDPRQNK